MKAIGTDRREKRRVTKRDETAQAGNDHLVCGAVSDGVLVPLVGQAKMSRKGTHKWPSGRAVRARFGYSLIECVDPTDRRRKDGVHLHCTAEIARQ